MRKQRNRCYWYVLLLLGIGGMVHWRFSASSEARADKGTALVESTDDIDQDSAQEVTRSHGKNNTSPETVSSGKKRAVAVKESPPQQDINPALGVGAADQSAWQASWQKAQQRMEAALAAMNLSAEVPRAASVLRLREAEEEMLRVAEARARELGWPIVMEDGQTRVSGLRENGLPIYTGPNNHDAAVSVNLVGARLRPEYENLTGAGMIIGEWDGGQVKADHVMLSGRVIQKDLADEEMQLSAHATHVAGTLIGAYFPLNPSTRGMASSATLWAHTNINPLSEQAAAGAVTLMSGYNHEKLLVSNHSYGSYAGWHPINYIYVWFGDEYGGVDSNFGNYNISTRNLDTVLWNTPWHLHVLSAGNSYLQGPGEGYDVKLNPGAKAVPYNASIHPGKNGAPSGFDTLPSAATSKNALVIGAANDAVSNGVRHVPSATMATFSSAGPTDDGRIKPDIVANGVNLKSAGIASISETTYSSGTSMAAPSVAGSALILQEYYRQRFDSVMEAARLKALIIHTADDIGAPGPDYRSGWGLMNVERALDTIKLAKDFYHLPVLTGGVLTQQQNSVRNYQVQHEGTTPLKVTLVWHDPTPTNVVVPGLNDRTPRLLNDLDLRILDSSGAVVASPWRLNPDVPSALPTTGDNVVDNVEQIEANLPAGTYTVRVSHKGTLASVGAFTGQRFSLVITGMSTATQIIPAMEVVGTAVSLEIPQASHGPAGHIKVRNSGAGTLSYQVTSNQPWLIPTITSGTSTGELDTIPFSLATSALALGWHHAIITVTPTTYGLTTPKFIKVSIRVREPEIIKAALDNSSLSWTTGESNAASYPATINGIRSPTLAYGGGSCVKTGNLSAGGTQWLQTQVQGAGTLQFRTAMQTSSGDILRVLVDGVQRFLTPSSHAWMAREIEITGAGTHTVRFEWVKGNAVPQFTDHALIDAVTFGTPPVIPVIPTLYSEGNRFVYEFPYSGLVTTWQVTGLTGNFPIVSVPTQDRAIIDWTGLPVGTHSVTITGSGTAGSASRTFTLHHSTATDFPGPDYAGAYTENTPTKWVTVTTPTHDGIDAAQSGNVGHGENGVFRFRVDGPGVLSWWWKTSCEPVFDRVAMNFNGAQQMQLSGDQDWQQASLPIPAGKDHLCEFIYWKDASGSVGLDRAWVDQVVFTPAPKILANGLPGGGLSPGTFGIALNRAMTYNLHVDGALSQITVDQLPAGLTLDVPNRRVTGTPTVAGTMTSVFTLTGPGGTTQHSVLWTVGPVYSLRDVVQEETFSYATTFDGWYGVEGLSAPASSDALALRSPVIGHGESTWMELQLPGPGKLNFDALLLCDSPSDTLEILLDGEPLGLPLLFQTGQWDNKTINVYSNGPHVLRFTYRKNNDGQIGGQDGVWLDRFSWTQATTYEGPTTLHTFLGQQFDYDVPFSMPGAYLHSISTLPPGVVFSNLIDPPDSTSRIYGTPTAVGTYEGLMRVWRVSDNVESRLDPFTVEVHPTTTLVAATDWASFFNYPISTGGDVPWFGQLRESADGVDAARSGWMNSNGAARESWLEFQIPGNVGLQWKWKVSCEDGGDRLVMLIDGVEQEFITGESGWQQRSVVVGAGTHTIRFVYRKDGTDDGGENAAWLDELSLVFAPSLTGPGGMAPIVGQTVQEPMQGTVLAGAEWSAQEMPPGLTISANGVIEGVPTSAGVWQSSITAKNIAGSSTQVVSIAVLESCDIATAVDNATFTWGIERGVTPWFGQHLQTNDSVDALQSGWVPAPLTRGDQADFTESVSTLTVTGPGRLEFWYRLDAPGDVGLLEVKKDGAVVLQKSSTTPWSLAKLDIQPGVSVLRFAYRRVRLGNGSEGRAWIDQMTWTPSQVPPPIAIQAVRTNSRFERTQFVDFMSVATRLYRLEVSTDLKIWTEVETPLMGDGELMSFTHQRPTPIPSRYFYRIIEEIP